MRAGTAAAPGSLADGFGEDRVASVPVMTIGSDGTEGPNIGVMDMVTTDVVVRIVRGDGEVVAGVWLRIDAADCRTPVHPARITDATGSVHFGAVAPGSYCLRSVTGDGATMSVDRWPLSVGLGTTSVMVALGARPVAATDAPDPMVGGRSDGDATATPAPVPGGDAAAGDGTGGPAPGGPTAPAGDGTGGPVAAMSRRTWATRFRPVGRGGHQAG